MKRLIYIILTLTVITACQKNPAAEKEPELHASYANLHGDWQLESWKEAPLPEGSYCRLNLDRSSHRFTLTQNLDSMYERTLSGSFVIEEDDYGRFIIKGEYDYGAGAWSRDYYVSRLKSDLTSMTWTSTSDPSDVSIYRKINTYE